jgi:hypothetical protein
MLSVIFQISLDKYFGTEKVSSERSGHETISYGLGAMVLARCGMRNTVTLWQVIIIYYITPAHEPFFFNLVFSIDSNPHL